MTVPAEALAWTLLPPVGGPPSRWLEEEAHLSSRVSPTVVAVGDHVLVWGGHDMYSTDEFGRPRPPEIDSGLTIDREGRVVRRWTIDWHGGDTAALVDDRVVVVGPGADGVQRALVFDPDDPERAERYPSALPSRTQRAAFTGRAFVVWGGELPNDDEARTRGRTWPTDDGAVFDVASRSWAPLPPAPLGGRANHVLEAVGDHVVAWGGSRWGDPGEAGPRDDGAVYHVGRAEWRPMSPSPLAPRSWASATTVGDRVFIGGGRGGDSPSYVFDAALYDPVADAWTKASKSSWRRAGASALAVGNTVLLGGGGSVEATSGGPVVTYDASADTWHNPRLKMFWASFHSAAYWPPAGVYVWSFGGPAEHAILVGSVGAGGCDTGGSAPSVAAEGVAVDDGLLDAISNSLGAVHLQLQVCPTPIAPWRPCAGRAGPSSPCPTPRSPTTPCPRSPRRSPSKATARPSGSTSPTRTGTPSKRWCAPSPGPSPTRGPPGA